MKWLRFALMTSILSVSFSAYATPDILKRFKEAYAKPDSNCQVCHTAPPQRNSYGKAVEAAIKKAGVAEPNLEIFKSIETADSDGDGSPNGDEIKASTLPGDPKSKPVPSKVENPQLVPNHSFHPAIIHFPIALLAVAALLQFISIRKKDELFHKASVINLAIGLICSIGAIVSGVAAWLRLGYSLEGNLLTHLILASSSILVGLAAYFLRDRPAYLWLIGLSGLLVLIAGHFGGTMVYG